MARHGEPRPSAAGGTFRAKHRAATRSQDRLPRGDRPQLRIYRRGWCAKSGARGGERRIRALSDATRGTRRKIVERVMEIIAADGLPAVRIITPHLHRDDRGFFYQVWHEQRLRETGHEPKFVQDNHVLS